MQSRRNLRLAFVVGTMDILMHASSCIVLDLRMCLFSIAHAGCLAGASSGALGKGHLARHEIHGLSFLKYLPALAICVGRFSYLG